jgi:hypothetical protein
MPSAADCVLGTVVRYCTDTARCSLESGLIVDEIQIIKVEIDGDDGIIVTFSDGTSESYVVEELRSSGPIANEWTIRPLASLWISGNPLNLP